MKFSYLPISCVLCVVMCLGVSNRLQADDDATSAVKPGTPPADSSGTSATGTPSAGPSVTPARVTTGPAEFKPAMQGDAELYLEIPIMGVVGVDTPADGVIKALDGAKARRVREVVLRINTTGGDLKEVDAIVDALHKGQGAPFHYHALVQSAQWATTPIIFACDSIHLLPNATIGGEGPKKKPGKDPDPNDEKSDKDLLPFAGNTTDSTPMPSLLLALVVPGSNVFGWKDDSGKIHVTEERPSDVPTEKMIIVDEDSNRLKLTGDQAVKIGLATWYTDTSRPPGVPATPATWAEMKPLGKFYIANAVEKMHQAKKAAELNAKKSAQTGEEAIARAAKVIDAINARINDAADNDPANGNDYMYYFEGSGMRLSGASQEKWQKRTDATLKCWADVKEGVAALKSLIDDAQTLKVTIPLGNMDPDATDRRADEEIRRLTEHRNDRHGNRGSYRGN